MIPNVHVFGSYSLLDLSLLLNAFWLAQRVARACGGRAGRAGAWSLALCAVGCVLSSVGEGLAVGQVRASALWRSLGELSLFCGGFCAFSWVECLFQRRRPGGALGYWMRSRVRSPYVPGGEGPGEGAV